MGRLQIIDPPLSRLQVHIMYWNVQKMICAQLSFVLAVVEL